MFPKIFSIVQYWIVLTNIGVFFSYRVFSADESMQLKKMIHRIKVVHVLEMLQCIDVPDSHVFLSDKYFTSYDLLKDMKQKGNRTSSRELLETKDRHNVLGIRYVIPHRKFSISFYIPNFKKEKTV